MAARFCSLSPLGLSSSPFLTNRCLSLSLFLSKSLTCSTRERNCSHESFGERLASTEVEGEKAKERSPYGRTTGVWRFLLLRFPGSRGVAVVFLAYDFSGNFSLFFARTLFLFFFLCFLIFSTEKVLQRISASSFLLLSPAVVFFSIWEEVLQEADRLLLFVGPLWGLHRRSVSFLLLLAFLSLWL